MNIQEGARRMQKAGRWLIALPLGLLLILFIVWAVEVLFVRNDLRNPLGMTLFCIPFLVPGTALWLAGWIVDGFAKEGSKDNSLEH